MFLIYQMFYNKQVLVLQPKKNVHYFYSEETADWTSFIVNSAQANLSQTLFLLLLANELFKIL